MIQRIYALPLEIVILLVLLLLVGWAFLWEGSKKSSCTTVNLVLLLITLVFIYYITILTRSSGIHEVVLTPFATFTAAHQQPELYREMLMNVFLFFPLGLTFSNALPRKWHRWGRIALTTLVGCALSAGIEYAQ